MNSQANARRLSFAPASDLPAKYTCKIYNKIEIKKKENVGENSVRYKKVCIAGKSKSRDCC